MRLYPKLFVSIRQYKAKDTLISVAGRGGNTKVLTEIALNMKNYRNEAILQYLFELN
jgi:hypothetical protein